MLLDTKVYPHGSRHQMCAAAVLQSPPHKLLGCPLCLFLWYNGIYFLVAVVAYVLKPVTLCRYGPDVGEAASDISHAAVQGGMTYFTVTRMGVSAVAKRIAKRTAKGLVKNTVNNVRNYHSGGSTVPGTQDVNLQAGRGNTLS